MTTVEIIRLLLPAGSTVGTGQGLDDDGNVVTFAVDHGCARDLINALELGGEVVVELEAWQVLNIAPAFEVVAQTVEASSE